MLYEVITDPNSGESYSLNPTGREILNLLSEGKTGEDIKGLLMDKYDVNPSTFNLYFDDFVQMLRHYNLIESEE